MTYGKVDMNQDNVIGSLWHTHDMIWVNDWTVILECTFDNQVLYVIEETNYSDLRENGMKWFVREADVWGSL